MRLNKIIFTILLSILWQQSFAADLLEVFQQAVLSDPELHKSKHQRLAILQDIPIQRANLLPTANVTADTTENGLHSNSPTGIPGVNVGDFHFFSTSYTVSLSQPLFNYEAWASLQSAKATVKAANANYAASVQDLINRVTEAYFNVLLAEDDLTFIQAEKRSIYRQLDQVRQQYKVGLVAITGVYQAQASYDLVIAEEISAKNNINNAREDLRAITGVYYEELAPLKAGVPLFKPDPVNVDRWVKTSDLQNWTIQAARFNAEAAKENINIQQSGHFPTVNAVGRFNRLKTGSQPGGKTNNRVHTYGVELNLPVFNGFGVTSSSTKAKFEYAASLDELDRTRRDVVNNTRQSYNNVIAGISKIKADRQAILSNESSLKSTEEAYKVGTQTVLDVLQAQQDLFDAQRIYSRDQYNFISATVDLKQSAGTLSIADIKEINKWLSPGNKAYSRERIKQFENTVKKSGDSDLSDSLYLKKIQDKK